MKEMKLGSLFDGIGGFPLAATMNGIRPVWASEIEAFPMAVTKYRFPKMKHMGDITMLHGENLPVVDVIAGGSPCQDLSVAGKREGLAGERSGLFMEQVRIVKEMRKQDGRRMRGHGRRTDEFIRPRYMVWENVPGAFSSGEPHGADFLTVLEEVCRIKEAGVSIPGPPGGAWTPAGIILGEGFSVAWRVLDAQFWGVPQRRNRIFLVADFGGYSAGEILFESDSVWRHYQKKREERKGVACYFKAGTDDAGRTDPAGPRKDYVICLLDQGGERMDVYDNKCGTLLAHGHSNPPIIMATSQGNAEIGIGYCPTITAAAGMAGNNQPILFDNHGPDTRYTGPVEVAQTITSALGTGGNNTPLALNKEPFCIAGNIINRKEKNGGNGCGYQQGISYTLTTEDRHCVYNPENKPEPYQQVIGTLCAGDERMISNQYVNQDKCIVDASKLVRRLIPLECERLMGFPDYWTDIPGASDSARYRALGNSVAVPCVDFILCGIAFYLSKMEEEDESQNG
ncbi:MAG: DNA cytosine methyltransferase [Lachnospiraceae bacterium]|nr:DNA cytosine methyltransferase [Lachnospiraceae bacterium]